MRAKRYSLEFTPEEISLINLDCGMSEMVRCTDAKIIGLIRHIIVLAKKGLLSSEDITIAEK